MKGFDANKHIREILSENEVQQLEAFNQNPVMREAVKKVLLLPLYSQGTLQKGKPANPMWNFMLGFVGSNAALKDEEVGRYAKVQYEGISAVEVGFDRISEFKSFEVPEKKINEAR